MKFKDMMDEDLDLLFDPDEIGEKVTFEGTEIIAIKSSEEFNKKYEGKNNDRYSEAGIYHGGITLSMKKEDFPSDVYINSTVNLDDESYEVIDIEDKGNTFRISLISNYK